MQEAAARTGKIVARQVAVSAPERASLDFNTRKPPFDADALAEQGRFGEAVHLILFRSIDDLAGRKPGSVRPALTSRDIAAMDAIPAPARSAFGHIADVVERSFFGGRPLGQVDFRDCRTAYERFAFAGGWR